MATGPAIPLGARRRARALPPVRAVRLRLRRGSCIVMRTPTTAIVDAVAVAALPVAAFFAPTPRGAIPTTFPFIAVLADDARPGRVRRRPKRRFSPRGTSVDRYMTRASAEATCDERRDLWASLWPHWWRLELPNVVRLTIGPDASGLLAGAEQRFAPLRFLCQRVTCRQVRAAVAVARPRADRQSRPRSSCHIP